MLILIDILTIMGCLSTANCDKSKIKSKVLDVK